MDSTARRISVIGLGRIGTAVAETFLANGCEVTVWNRSPAKAERFEGRARVAPTTAEACLPSEVVVVCLVDPAACSSVLRNAATEAAMAGKVLVQLTTTTPADAHDEAGWAAGCGARYLGGAILASPAMVGSALAKTFYAGPREVFDEYEPWLRALTPNTTWCGEEIGRAATMDHALLQLSYGCLAVLFQSMALCEAGGVPLDDFVGQITLFRDGFVEQRAGAIGSGAYPSGSATMHTFASWARQLVGTTRSVGVSSALPEALLEGIAETVRLGHGEDDYQSLYEALRRRN